MKRAESYIQALVKEQSLPSAYVEMAGDYLWPLVQDIVQVRPKSDEPLLVGIQGTQGSGKSTVSLFLKALLEQCFDLNVQVLSLDDFYLTRDARIGLSHSIHPLLQTRGVPGTHDMHLLQTTVEQLKQLPADQSMRVPCFNKGIDDREPDDGWPVVTGGIDVILFEGWCVGIPSQPNYQLNDPINQLEKEEDPLGIWRFYVNDQLKLHYEPFYAQLHHLIVLKAPSFKQVFKWRLLQEEKLKQKLLDHGQDIRSLRLLSPDDIARFIAHYERLTRYGFQVLPELASWEIELDDQHNMTRLTRNNQLVEVS